MASIRPIAEANNLTLTTILSVGQELIIPDVTPTPGPRRGHGHQRADATAVLSLAELLPTRDPDAAGYPYRDPVLLVPTNGSRVGAKMRRLCWPGPPWACSRPPNGIIWSVTPDDAAIRCRCGPAPRRIVFPPSYTPACGEPTAGLASDGGAAAHRERRQHALSLPSDELPSPGSSDCSPATRAAACRNHSSQSKR